MKRTGIIVFCIVLFFLQTDFSQEKIEIPLKFDINSNSLYQFQVPLTLGSVVDFGMGFSGFIPSAYFYVFSEEKRQKKIFFLNRDVEIKRIKLMWGLSEEFLYEFRFQHIYNDSFDITNILNFLGTRAPVKAIPLTFSYDFRTFGSASNPTLNTFGMGYTNLGPIELNVFFQAYRDTGRYHGLTEIGLKLYDYRPFGVVLGDLTGLFSIIDVSEINTRFKPRIAAGYSRKTDSLSFGLLLHADSSITENSTLKLNSMLLFPVSGEPYWSFQGQYDYSSQLSVLFNCSLEGFFLENKYILDLSDIFNLEK